MLLQFDLILASYSRRWIRHYHLRAPDLETARRRARAWANTIMPPTNAKDRFLAVTVRDEGFFEWLDHSPPEWALRPKFQPLAKSALWPRVNPDRRELNPAAQA
jgi:hypothetical protein